MPSLVDCASRTALRTTSVVCTSWRLISPIEEAISSAAVAAVATLVEASFAALHRALRALRGLTGRGKQRACGQLHRGRALVHRAQHALHALAEGGDGALDHGAALVFRGMRCALPSRACAARSRPDGWRPRLPSGIGCSATRNHASVGSAGRYAMPLSARDPAPWMSAILIVDVAVEISDLGAVHAATSRSVAPGLTMSATCRTC